ncbi:MAG: ketopantoate reductase family protein [Hyphomicrobiaceae bacterium]
MRIATVATGGIGGFLAARLGQAGHQVATVARGAHLAAICERGLSLRTELGKSTFRPWMATDQSIDIGEVDVVIFAVKGDDLKVAAEACRPLLGPDTVVVPFLNGVEAADRLVEILPPENVANGVAYISTTVVEPGLIEQIGEFNRFVFAERDNRPSQRIDVLRTAINDAGSSAPPTQDIEAEVWKKFLMFSALSGVTAAARCTIKDILENEPLAGLFRSVIAETASIGRARGVDLSATSERETWAAAHGLPHAMRASTAIDLENGRPLEIEWISGAVARLAKDNGLEAPINMALYALLSPYRHGRNQ